MRKETLFATIFLASALVVGGQQQNQQPAPSPQPSPSPGPSTPTTPTPTPGRTPSPFPTERQQQPQQTYPDMQRPIFLSGRVMLDDGTPPSEPVVIERVCNGVARPEAYTSSKGQFSFQLGQRMGMMADASVGGGPDAVMDGGFGGRSSQRTTSVGGFGSGINEMALMGCEIRAVLPGYRSDVVNLAGRRSLENPDVGTIILHRLGNVEGTTISATSLNAPKDAKKAYQKGMEALKKKKPADAQKRFQKAVDEYPRYAAAWYGLGQAHMAQNNPAEARKCFAASLEADPKYLNPYLSVATIAAGERNWQEVADTTAKLIRLDPVDYPQAYYFNSVANYNLGKTEEAEKSAREAQRLDTHHRYPRVAHLLGVILANRREYNAAAEQMRTFLKFAPDAADASTVRTQLSEIEKLAGPQQPAPQP